MRVLILCIFLTTVARAENFEFTSFYKKWRDGMDITHINEFGIASDTEFILQSYGQATQTFNDFKEASACKSAGRTNCGPAAFSDTQIAAVERAIDLCAQRPNRNNQESCEKLSRSIPLSMWSKGKVRQYESACQRSMKELFGPDKNEPPRTISFTAAGGLKGQVYACKSDPNNFDMITATEPQDDNRFGNIFDGFCVQYYGEFPSGSGQIQAGGLAFDNLGNVSSTGELKMGNQKEGALKTFKVLSSVRDEMSGYITARTSSIEQERQQAINTATSLANLYREIGRDAEALMQKSDRGHYRRWQSSNPNGFSLPYGLDSVGLSATSFDAILRGLGEKAYKDKHKTELANLNAKIQNFKTLEEQKNEMSRNLAGANTIGLKKCNDAGTKCDLNIAPTRFGEPQDYLTVLLKAPLETTPPENRDLINAIKAVAAKAQETMKCYSANPDAWVPPPVTEMAVTKPQPTPPTPNGRAPRRSRTIR